MNDREQYIQDYFRVVDSANGKSFAVAMDIITRGPTMKWKAATDRVLIQAEERKETTDSGIVIPANAKVGTTAKGVVLASGPNATNVLPGDIAIYDTKYARVIAEGVVTIQADFVLALQRDEQE